MEGVERIGARRVVISSLADLRIAALDETRFHEFVYSLTQRFPARREHADDLRTPDLFRVERISDPRFHTCPTM
jgi:circadian clock protein KaiC